MAKQPNSHEINIETIETPKGNVPTVQGLENVINLIMEQVSPLAQAIQGIHTETKHIRTTLDYLGTFVQQIGDNLGEFLVLMAKLNSNIDTAFNEIENNRGLEEQQNLLIELQTIIAKLLVQFQSLPVLQQIKNNTE